MSQDFTLSEKRSHPKRPRPPKEIGRLEKNATFGNRGTPPSFLSETESERKETHPPKAVAVPPTTLEVPAAAQFPPIASEITPAEPCSACLSALWWRYSSKGCLRCSICDPPVKGRLVRSWRMLVTLDDGSPAWEVFVPRKLRKGNNGNQ